MEKKLSVLKCLAVLLLLAFAIPSAWPQASTGTVSGTVRDQSGAVIPNIEVTLTGAETNVVLRSRTNGAGLYFFAGVIAGSYQVSVTAPGMEKYAGAFTVQATQNVVIDPVLKPGQVTTSVVVADVTPLVTVNNPTVSDNMETARIEQLPVPNRVLNVLIQTLPGIVPTGNQYQGGPSYRVFGAPADAVEWTQDGTSETDRRWNMTYYGQDVGLGSVQEFTVASNAVSAKDSRPTTIIASTKNGTNQFHGTMYEDNRNNGYGLARARTDYYTKAPPLNFNQFGFNGGGPVYIPKVYNGKNKTFWFFNGEFDTNTSLTTSSYNVPTDAMKSGDFSGLIDTQGRLYAIYDPLSTGAAPNYARTPFVNNTIPANRESPVAKYLFGITPEPSLATNPMNAANLYMPVGDRGDFFKSLTARVDQQFSDRDLFFARLTDLATPSVASGSPGLPATNQVAGWKTTLDREKTGSATWNHIFSPTFANELMASFRYRIGGGYTGTGPTLSQDWFSKLGMPNPFNDKDWTMFSNMGLGNYAMTGPGMDRANETYYILDDNLTMTRGSHEFQFGGHLRYDLMNVHPNDASASSFTFATLATSLYSPTASTPTNPAATPYTGSNLANMFLGVSTYQASLIRAWDYLREGETALYFQDNYRATRRLTLNMGLRWEYWALPRDKNNVLVGFDPAKDSVVLGTDLNTMYAFGNAVPSIVSAYQALGLNFESYQNAGLPQNLLNSRKTNFGPRAGFAYRALDGKKAFVVRGGYSLSYFAVNLNNVINDYNASTPLTGTFNYNPYTDATQSPNGLGNYGLMSIPQYQNGVNDSNAISVQQPRGITRGSAVEYFMDPNSPTSRVHTWNFTLEKEAMANVLARVRYVGNHSSDLGQTWNLNNATATYVYYATTLQPLPTGAYSSVALRPLDQQVLGTINEYRNTGWANVQSIDLETERRYSKGYAWEVSYVLSNALAATGSVPTTNQYMPGTVPTDPNQLNAFLNYQRDTGIPKHMLKWNWLVDLPIGKGKPLLGNAGKVLDKVIGGWQLAGLGTLRSTYFTVGSSNWNFTGAPLQVYGYKYPIQNCTVNPCQPGYLWYNGYIPANQINSHAANGQPNGYEGVPADYKPAVTPLIPYGSTTLPANAPSNLNISSYWDTNNVWIPLKNGTTQVVAYNPGLNPWRNQYMPGVRQWQQDASLFKNIPIHERISLRFTADFFNVFNHPGNPNSVGSTGFENCQSSGNTPRTIQFTLRLTW